MITQTVSTLNPMMVLRDVQASILPNRGGRKPMSLRERETRKAERKAESAKLMRQLRENRRTGVIDLATKILHTRTYDAAGFPVIVSRDSALAQATSVLMPHPVTKDVVHTCDGIEGSWTGRIITAESPKNLSARELMAESLTGKFRGSATTGNEGTKHETKFHSQMARNTEDTLAFRNLMNRTSDLSVPVRKVTKEQTYHVSDRFAPAIDPESPYTTTTVREDGSFDVQVREPRPSAKVWAERQKALQGSVLRPKVTRISRPIHPVMVSDKTLSIYGHAVNVSVHSFADSGVHSAGLNR